MTAKNIAPIWPLNEVGEILVERGVGTTAIESTLGTEFVPSDPSSNKVVIKFPDDMPAVQNGSGAPNDSDGYPDGSIYIRNGTGVYVKVSGVYEASSGSSGPTNLTGLLTNGTPVVVALNGVATSVYLVSINPVSGDTITVESGTSSSGPWTAWPDGPMPTPDYAYFYPEVTPVTHMRFTRSSGSGTTSRYYITEVSR